jgi:hypothetical protein
MSESNGGNQELKNRGIVSNLDSPVMRKESKRIQENGGHNFDQKSQENKNIRGMFYDPIHLRKASELIPSNGKPPQNLMQR